MHRKKDGKGSKKKTFSYDDVRLRIATIATWLYDPTHEGVDPDTGEPVHTYYINPDIQSVIDKNIDQIKSYAWIIHDKDLILKGDYDTYQECAAKYDEGDAWHQFYKSLKIDDRKPINVHILVRFKEPRSRRAIAKIFNCSTKVVKGGILGEKGQHWSSGPLIYFLHRNAPDKHQYDVSELHADADTLTNLDDVLKKYESGERVSIGMAAGKSYETILAEIYAGKTMSEVYHDKDVDKVTYTKYLRQFRDAEAEYRKNEAELPEYLLNIYIEGESGTGKTSIAKILSRYLYPDVENPYFTVGAKKVAFQTYAGEKIIIWDDITVDKMLDIAPEGEIQEFLDPYQRERKALNIKSSYVILTNYINIFTSTIPHDEFFEQLLKRSDTSSVQIYRRIPILLELKSDSMALYINRGEWKRDSSLWKEYDRIPIANVSLKMVMETVPDSRLSEVLEAEMEIIYRIIQSFLKWVTKKNSNDGYAIYNVIKDVNLAKESEVGKYINRTILRDIKKRHDDLKERFKEDYDATISMWELMNSCMLDGKNEHDL